MTRPASAPAVAAPRIDTGIDVAAVVAGIQQGVLASDIPVLAARPLRPGVDPASLPVVADQRWRLSPAIFEDHGHTRSLNFALQPERFWGCAKRHLWLLLNHDQPPGLPGSAARRLSVDTILKGFDDLAAFLHWLDTHTIARLADVTADDLDAYLRDLLASERSRAAIADRIIEVRRLWAWRRLLPADDRLPQAPPWGGEHANTVVGHRPTQGENRTPRIHPDTMDRLLCWALRFVDTFADDIIAAAREHRRLYHRSAKPHRGRSPRRSHRRGELERELRALIERHQASGTPLPGVVGADGHRAVAWEHLGRLLDCVGYGLKQRLGWIVEDAGLPVADAAYLDAPITGCLNGKPWRRHPVAYHEAEPLAQHLATACFVVVAYLSGMRPGEALSLRRGRVGYDQVAGLWLLRGRAWKGAVDQTGAKRPEGEERADPWVVVEPVARAVGVLERLHDHELLFPVGLFTGSKSAKVSAAGGRRGMARTGQAVTQDITRLVEWVNAYCQANDRHHEQIPPDPSGRPLAPSRLRRTLAWFIVRRPRGLVAGAIQYGHVQARVTLGYSGTYASGFPDEHAFETWLLRLEQLAGAQQRLAAGEHVSGPAARRYRERVQDATRKFAGRALTSTRQARDLLANPALQLYPGKAMTCVFDPAKAKCRLTPSGDDARRTPNLSDCQPGCQNITRTDHDIIQLRRQAAELAALVDDPLSPEPRRQRERHTLDRLAGILDEHERTRPNDHPASSTGSAADAR